MLATALEKPQRPETPIGVVNLESPKQPAFAFKIKAGALAAAEGAGATTAGQSVRRVLDRNASASAPAQTPSRQPVLMVPQAPWVLPLVFAAPPASLAALHSTRAAAPAATGPLRRARRRRRRRPPTPQPARVQAGQQRVRERALHQASGQRPRREAF